MSPYHEEGPRLLPPLWSRTRARPA